MTALSQISKTVFAALIAAGTVLSGAPANATSIGFGSSSAIAAPADASAPGKLIHHRKGPGRDWGGGPRWHAEPLGPRQIRRSLRNRGFHKIRIIDRRRGVYIVRARGWRGWPVRLVVDARTAEILRRKPVGRGFDWNYSW